MNPYELTASITAAANAVACKLNDDELSLLSAVLVQLGDTLATIVTQRGICENEETQRVYSGSRGTPAAAPPA